MASSDDENLSSDDGDDLNSIEDDDRAQSSEEEDEKNSGLNLTGFLFGNIDKEGKLEADILDDESKRQLATLGKFGLMSMLQNVIKEDDQNGEPSADSDNDLKSPTAEDYSDITELAEDEGGPYLDDKFLMPPPPTPQERMRILSASEAKKKLETPLAAMLPSKYANISVQEIFPDFRPDKVLRFSRLFGPGKHSSLPHMWRGVKYRRKKKKPPEAGEPVEEIIEFRPLVLRFGPIPTPDMCNCDAEEKFLKPQDKDSSLMTTKTTDEDKGPNVADWRFGPAQLWYDILGVPETGNTDSKVIYFSFYH